MAKFLDTIRVTFRVIVMRLRNVRWVAATVLLCIAALITVGSIVYTASQPSAFWHSVVFQDLASIGTFAAAGAAWLSALVVLASQKMHQNSSESGMSEYDSAFMLDLSAKMAEGRLRPEDVDALSRILRVTRGDSPVHAETAITPGSEPRSADPELDEIVTGRIALRRGENLWALGQLEEARSTVEEAIAILHPLAIEHPRLRTELSVAMSLLAFIVGGMNEKSKAQELRQKARDINNGVWP
jgi:hypothetical protein